MTIWATEIKELEKLFESLKGSYPDLEKELGHLIKTDDENVALLYSRRCLEIIITDLCECELKRPRKTEPLKGIIDKLNREGSVPSHIVASMHNLNSLSTFGAHPKEFDPEQVKPVLSNLTIIIKWYLKYKETQSIIKPKSEEVKDETEGPGDSSEQIKKSKKRILLLLSGFLLVCVIVIVVLVLFNIAGGRKQVVVDTSFEKSIAVIPFKNFSADPDQEYMSDGLTDEIINHLYKIASFDKVVSLNTVLTYKKTDKKTSEIADELKVNYILEGTYKKIGDQVRVTAQLIEPKNDNHIWLNTYNRPYEEIITIQSDIALQIADHLKAFLTSSERQNIQKIPTTNQEAYELVQQGWYLWNTTGLNGLDQQIDLCLQAIEIDPDYADAYAMAGTFTLLKGCYGGGSEIQSVVWDATHYFEKALELDQNNSTAHFGLALFNDWVKWDYIKAEKEYLKAIELLPNNLQWIDGYVEFLIKLNRFEKALSYLDTTTLSDYYDFITIQIISGNKNEVYNSTKTSLEALRERGNRWVGKIYISLEKYDSSILYLESALQSEAPEMLLPRFQACLALAYHKTKHYQQARTIINQLIEMSDTTSVGSPDYFIGWYYSGIVEVDSAFYWLEKAYQNRSPEMPWLKVDPVFKNLKGDERYWDLYERIGHKAYDEYRESMKQ
ncbi:MAG: hypothetical protein AMS27_17895 [Bacteroides sp. SM23_62_1]|nr:MAG: hypothetical protein AMS27_17895 [Bacteroides sp. SM23_62_1]